MNENMNEEDYLSEEEDDDEEFDINAGNFQHLPLQRIGH